MNQALEAAGTVRGDLLSCYVTAVAGLLDAHGVDPTLAIGGQLFLGVRTQDGLTEFLHHHTPLTGDGVRYRIGLVRCGAADPTEAADRIAAEARRAGVAVVTGATGTVPWLENEADDRSPHWFLVRPAPGGALEVDDRFSWIDETGEHPGHLGVLDPVQAGRLTHSPWPLTPEHASRERWALGERRERPAWSTTRPWQWFECDDVEVGDIDPVDAARAVLQRTVDGVVVDPAGRAEGWVTGEAAFEALAEMVEAGLEDPLTYRYHNDFWVAGRNRQMFAVALRAAERAGVAAGLTDLAEDTEQDLVPAWTGLVRAMRYNALRAERGMRPRTVVLTELRRIGAAETRLRDRLGAVLRPG